VHPYRRGQSIPLGQQNVEILLLIFILLFILFLVIFLLIVLFF
jgi:hypothetical protein